MLDENTLIKVTNRDNGSVGYTIPDLNNLHRTFQPGETKSISYEELKRLSWVPGGDVILRDYLVIDNKEAVTELLNYVEPEYFYTEEDVDKLLTVGTIEQFLDTLDFAPEGVIELIKDKAVKTKLNDVSKRKAILEKTGFDVSTAISINEESKEIDNKATTGARRAAPINSDETSNKIQGRRTAAPQTYKVVTKK